MAVLLTLLIPSFNRARDRALSLQCGSHQRQMGGAMFQYADDSGDFFPLGEGLAGEWRGPLAPYLGFEITSSKDPSATQVMNGSVEKVMFCPAAWNEVVFDPGVGGFWAWLGGPWNLRVGSIGINWACYDKTVGIWQTNPWRLAEVRRPEDKFCYGDLSSDYQLYGTLWMKFLTIWVHNVSYQMKGPGTRHEGKGNYLFMDGHVGMLSKETLQPPYSKRAYIEKHHYRMKAE